MYYWIWAIRITVYQNFSYFWTVNLADKTHLYKFENSLAARDAAKQFDVICFVLSKSRENIYKKKTWGSHRGIDKDSGFLRCYVENF